MLTTIKPVMLSALIPINGFGDIYPNYHLKPINVLLKKTSMKLEKHECILGETHYVSWLLTVDGFSY